MIADGTGPQAPAGLAEVLRHVTSPSTVLHLHRGAGESAALSVGFRQAKGDAIVILPAYPQVDEAEIGRITASLLDGEHDYVASWRHPRVDGRADRALSGFFNALTRRVTGTQLHDINSSLRAMKRAVVAEVPLQGDLHRFLPILASMQGFRVGEIPVRHIAERVRRGDYRLGIFVRRVLDLLTLFFLIKFTRKPLRFFGLLGTAVFAVGAVILTILFVERLFGVALRDRPLLVYGVFMFVLGAQLFSIGLLGELIIFTYGREVAEYKVETVYESTPAG